MDIISDEDVQRFLSSSPREEDVMALSVHGLRLVANYLRLNLGDGITKGRLITMVTRAVCDDFGEEDGNECETGRGRDGVLSQPVSERDGGGNILPVPTESSSNTSESQLRLELARVELEKGRVELENNKIKYRMLEIQGRDVSPHVRRFDVIKASRVVPPFTENDVDGFFCSFERMADQLEWPKCHWPVLLHTVITGKARSAYAALTSFQCKDYDLVKKVILQSYELVPEAYRIQFRSAHRQTSQSCVEYASDLRLKWERWIRSCRINTMGELAELCIMEQFRRGLPKEMAAYLIEKGLTNVSEAAIAADTFEVTHPRPNFGRPHRGEDKGGASHKNVPPSQGQSGYSGGNRGTQPKTGHGAAGTGKTGYGGFNPKCYGCGQAGHLRRDCRASGKTMGRPVGLVSRGDEQASARVGVESEEGRPVSLVSVLKDTTKVTTTRGNECVQVDGYQETSGSQEESVPSGRCSGGRAELPMQSGDCDPTLGTYDAFLSTGTVTSESESKEVTVLRDSGALQSLLLHGSIEGEETGRSVVLKDLGRLWCVPLVRIHIQSREYVGRALVAVVKELPVPGVDLIIGNDLAGGRVGTSPVVTERPVDQEEMQVVEEADDLFPVCAVTRAQTRKREAAGDVPEMGMARLFEPARGEQAELGDQVALGELQRRDPELQPLFQIAEGERESTTRFFLEDGILKREWQPRDCTPEDVEWRKISQVVLPKQCRRETLSLAHDSRLAGHLGVRKTLQKIWSTFYWPGMKKDVANYCRTCHTCQLVGKPNARPDKAPLVPLPVFDAPFDRVMIDVVGPLPRTAAGNMYIFTLMDLATRYPEAVPVRSIKSKIILRELTTFFTRFGLPKEIQSDQGSNFMSREFKDSMRALGITQITSSAYHPQSQGALERYHQTMKNMLKKYCLEHERDWDKGLPYLLFAAREAPSESLGFSPFELLFTHSVRGPMQVLKEAWIGQQTTQGLLTTVTELKERLRRSWELAKENLLVAQGRFKYWHDKKARVRSYQVGDKVLALLPVLGQPLQAKYSGPYRINKKISATDYVINTPDRWKKQRLCHLNLLKPYHQREEEQELGEETEQTETGGMVPVCLVSADPSDTEVGDPLTVTDLWRGNQLAWAEMAEKLAHLPADQYREVSALLGRYPTVFRDTPGRTRAACHDIDVGDATPVKQAPYRVSPHRATLIQEELDYMLSHGLIEPAYSEWSSPVTLVPKADGSHRFCIDYRKVNALTRADSYPLPRVDDCIDCVGSSRFISKFDLVKGYWQVPLSDRAQEISCFTALGRTYKCLVMPFGLKNAPACFQRMMNTLTADIPGCVTYLDDVIIHSDTWQDHLEGIEALLRVLQDANLVLNLKKCHLVQAKVQYLGYVIGQGELAPPQAKIEAVMAIPSPRNRKEVRRFLGLCGYYRRFVPNFATVVAPVTDLLKGKRTFKWTEKEELSFVQLKTVLCNAPVLRAPDFGKPFKLMCDASDVGSGAVLMQEDSDGIDRPVCYYSKKFNSAQRNYSTIEKELLALVQALQHFSVYACPSGPTVIIYTDHHPLKYLNHFRDKNQRLTRWSLYLQEFDLDVRHVKGRDNIIADCLSRCGQ